MKRIFVLLAVLATFSLAACAGGGSGGGGAGAGAGAFSNPPLTISKVTGGATSMGETDLSGGAAEAGSDSDGFGMGATGFTGKRNSLDILYNGVLVAKFDTGPNGQLDLYDNGFMATDVAVVTPELQAAIDASDDFGDKSGHYENLSMDYHGKRTLTFAGDIAHTNTAVILNAEEEVPLQHSVFGAWLVETNYKGSIDGVELGTDGMNLQQVKIIADASNSATLISPAADDAFTGKAVAIAYAPGENYTDFKDAMIFGDVSMKISGDGSRANASFNFDGYYKIDYNNLVVATAPYAGQVVMRDNISQVTVDNSLGADRNGFAIDHSKLDPNTDNTYLGGKFYQNVPQGNVLHDKEGVGEFGVRDQSGNGVYGSFGVVKQ